MSIYTYTPKIEVTDIAFHRNGIDGAPFYPILFQEKDEGHMLAILFDKPHHCAVLNIDKLAQGDIKFGSNSYRGDLYERLLRPNIVKYSLTGEVL
jgi:hypothetical protein